MRDSARSGDIARTGDIARGCDKKVKNQIIFRIDRTPVRSHAPLRYVHQFGSTAVARGNFQCFLAGFLGICRWALMVGHLILFFMVTRFPSSFFETHGMVRCCTMHVRADGTNKGEISNCLGLAQVAMIDCKWQWYHTAVVRVLRPYAKFEGVAKKQQQQNNERKKGKLQNRTSVARQPCSLSL